MREALKHELSQMSEEDRDTIKRNAKMIAIQVKGISYEGALELLYCLGCFVNHTGRDAGSSGLQPAWDRATRSHPGIDDPARSRFADSHPGW